MALPSTYFAALKADISVNTNTVLIGGVPTAINVVPNNSDGNFAIAEWYSSTATPNYTAWKTLVSIGDVGKSFNGSELAGMTTGNQTRLQTLAIYFQAGVNPSLADTRAFFDDVFSGAGGATTRANLATLWKRLANRVEKLLKTSGTGTTGDPAVLGYVGTITGSDVEAARNS